MSHAKNWELTITIVAHTKRKAELLKALISDVADKHSEVRMSSIINGIRRYRRRAQ